MLELLENEADFGNHFLANQPLAGRHEESNPPTPSKKDRNIMKHINDEMPSKIRCKIRSAQFRTG